MPRHPADPSTRLGQAMQARRGDSPLRDVAVELGVANTTLSHLERGTHRPSLDTARKLAVWLSWSIEEVVQAAETPASPG